MVNLRRELGKQIFKNSIILSIYIFLLEIVVKINTNNNVFDWSTLRIFVSSLTFGLFFGLITSLFRNRISRIFNTFISFIIMFYTWVEINLYSYIGFFMGVGNAEQGTKLGDYIKDVISVSKWQSYLVIIPFIIYLLYVWYLDKKIIRNILDKTTVFIFKKEKFLKKGLIYIGSMLSYFIVLLFFRC